MESKKIWKKKDEIFGDFLKDSKFKDLFKEEPNKLYLPGKRPNDISEEEWKKMVEENPIYGNNDLPIAVSKQGEIVCLEPSSIGYTICIAGIKQFGKCLKKDTKLFVLINGMYYVKTIDELSKTNEKIHIPSLNSEFNIEWKNIESINYNGQKQIFKVLLKNGSESYLTKNHKMLILDEDGNLSYKQLNDLKKGEYLPCCKNINLDSNQYKYHLKKDLRVDNIRYKHPNGGYTTDKTKKKLIFKRGKQLDFEFDLNEDLGFICGVYLAEGWIRLKEQIGLAIKDDLLKQKTKETLNRLGFDYRITTGKRGNIFIKGKRSIELKHFLYDEFKSGSKNKDIPSWVFSANHNFKKGLLSGYFSGDGSLSISKKHLCFSFMTKSKRLADKLSLLFKSFGFLNYQKIKEIKSGKYKGNKYYRVFFEPSYLDMFIKKIGIFHSTKSKIQLTFNSKNKNQRMDVIPLKKNMIKNISDNLSKRGTLTRKHLPRFRDAAKHNKPVGRIALKKFLELINKDTIKLSKLIDGDVYWSKIVSIEEDSIDDVYDLSVEGNHNFMLENGLFVHNSTSEFALADQMYWHGKYKVAFMNEGLGICFDHLYPNNAEVFKNKLSLLNMKPMGLPLVFCYPSTKDISTPGIKPEFIVSIPWKKYLEDPDNFSDLGKSSKHLIKLTDELSRCNTIEEVEDIFSYNPYDMPQQSCDSLFGSINELAKHKIFDLNDNGHSIFKLSLKGENKFKKKPFHPIIALLKCGLIPCLMTPKLAGTKYEEQVFNFYLWMIWHEKEKGGVLRDEPVALFVDELNQVQGVNKEILIKIVREGGNLGKGGISFIYCCQNYSDVEKVIRTNTTIGVIFRQAHSEATEIGKEYNLQPYLIDRIQNLEKFECLLVTKNQFKVYNPLTGECYITKEPILCEFIPPLSLHRKELSLDSYKERNIRLHERVLRIGKWVCRDKTKKKLWPYRNLAMSVNGEKIKENHEQTKQRLNIQPLTIIEGTDLKKSYFRGKIQENEELGYNELIRKGFRIISAPASFVIEGSTQIRVVYLFWPIDKVAPSESRVLDSCPDVTIMFNNNKNAVRMFGVNCCSLKTGRLGGASDWLKIDSESIEEYCSLIKDVLQSS